METAKYITAWKKRFSEKAKSLKVEREKIISMLPGAVTLLKKGFHIERVYLFGSLMKDTFNLSSDIDIAVKGLYLKDYPKALSLLWDYFGREINLVPLELASPSLARVIIKEGRLLYQRK